MSEPQESNDEGACADGPRKHSDEGPRPRRRGKPVLDVDSERRDFGAGSDIHCW